MPRNIPTRVGKTRTAAARSSSTTEHPHASGENQPMRGSNTMTCGTSPREWGKRQGPSGRKDADRNIPTRVGKTFWRRVDAVRPAEHPHASGENYQPPEKSPMQAGTSPREWGKLLRDGREARVGRNIPTRVGKTVFEPSRIVAATEHPHASGENVDCDDLTAELHGTSPREWGKPGARRADERRRRNIPTRVGKTARRSPRTAARTEHPHASGENGSGGEAVSLGHGTSPREWGKPFQPNHLGDYQRNIPTRVGKTVTESSDSQKLHPGIRNFHDADIVSNRRVKTQSDCQRTRDGQRASICVFSSERRKRRDARCQSARTSSRLYASKSRNADSEPPSA